MIDPGEERISQETSRRFAGNGAATARLVPIGNHIIALAKDNRHE
jgi:hypothetical protein